MDLRFSHVDVLVSNLEDACAYYAKIFKADISRKLCWQRGGLHVQYAIVRFGFERFILVQPYSGNLRELLDNKGEGTIYRQCYMTSDIEAAYDELVALGVKPVDENGAALARSELRSPSGARIFWLPKRFGEFSIEVLDRDELESFIESVFD